MDPDFQRILFRVILIGAVIGVVGAGGLVIAFRAFRRGGSFAPSVLVAAAITRAVGGSDRGRVSPAWAPD